MARGIAHCTTKFNFVQKERKHVLKFEISEKHNLKRNIPLQFDVTEYRQIEDAIFFQILCAS